MSNNQVLLILNGEDQTVLSENSNKIIKSINGQLGKIQKNSKEFKIYFITAFTVNQKNYFKISCNFKKNNIKPHIKSYLSKILIRELNLKGVNFNLIF